MFIDKCSVARLVLNCLHLHFLLMEQGEDRSNQSETWSILRDDFMMGAKMKDWDRDSNECGDNDAS